MGTPALAVPSLELLRAEYEIVLAVTQPDRPAGRGHKLLPPPVKEYAQAHQIPVAQPERARDQTFIDLLEETKPDAIAVVAYGQILPRAILELPQKYFPGGGCINLHFSLLPRWRGAAPVQYAIWHGDEKTGVSTQWMAEKLDAGNLILQREVAVETDETSATLFEKLTPLGAQTLLETVRLVQRGAAPSTPQQEDDATYAPTLKREESEIVWTQSAMQIERHVRAFNPRPTAQCRWKGAPFKVHNARALEASLSTLEQSTFGESTSGANPQPGTVIEVRDKVLIAAASGALELLEVQPPGKAKRNALDWARGARLQVGQIME